MASRPPKRRKLTPPGSVGEASPEPDSRKLQKAFFKNAVSWDLEQDYEKRARKSKKKDKKQNDRLPVKSLDGRLAQAPSIPDDAASVESDADWLGSDVEEGETLAEEASEHVREEPQVPPREQIRRAQEELAKYASQLNEDPEESAGAFKAIAVIGQSRLLAVQKLCLVTQLAVYKDVIPGYRIRPASEAPPGEKLSKEVRRLRTFEQALVSGYQGYVKELSQYAASKHPSSPQPTAAKDLSTIAINCACALLTAVPHFNFRNELIRILVRKLSSRNVDESFLKCRQTLETLFREDEEGRPSLEAVSLLSKMMKARDYRVDESVLNLFLHLRLLSEFSGKASQDNVERPNGTKATIGPNHKGKKRFLTKRERKSLREQKALEKDMAQADALVSHEERERLQSDTLKLVFATYFRILKLRSPHLMGAVLEGLAKYAHLINQDFFGDLLEALKDLIRHSDGDTEDGAAAAAGEDEEEDTIPVVRNPNREALLCTVTAFALLAGQDAHNSRADLHLDLSFFTTHLYRSLLPLSVNPDIELNAKSLRLPDPDAPNTERTKNNRINLETMTVLLIRCLSAVLLPPWNIRSVPPLLLAAFAKQLMSTSLQVPEKSCQAILALLDDVARTHGRKIRALWNTEERRGDGVFNPLSDDIESSNPFATTVWEGELLRKHYCPKVREGIKLLEKTLASS
ncbi:hypothetical protein VTK73DRAFT_1719 [Phialemonium thermophilum]|uniref:Nucleolar complex-associated protein 3 n=1 Tax=Phialemonium thermophilum TaxID=223376 RepID=A0ABR3X8K9_9PEZI